MQQSGTALKRVGTEVVNTVRVPVFELPDGTRYMQIIDANCGLPGLVSVEGGKKLRTVGYAFAPNVEKVVVEELFNADRPFVLEDDAEQKRRTQRLLGTLMDQVVASGISFEFMPN